MWRRRLFWLILCGVLLAAGALPARAQAQERSLAERLRAARLPAQARVLVSEQGRAGAARPPQRLRTPALDSITAMLREANGLPPLWAEGAEAPAFPVEQVERISRLVRGWFEEEFAGVQWTFLGNEGLTPVDTSFTRDLRAHLEAAFGAPTLTLVDRIERPGAVPAENVQFEYWFVVNDSIPLIVMDPSGPFGRGLVVAGPRRYRDVLPALRAALLGPVATSGERAPYVDYYFDRQEAMWYRTGFDGERFFLRRIPRRQVLPDQRPWLRTTTDN